MKEKKQNALTVLLGYAGSHRRLTFLGLGLSAISMVCSMIPYLCIWLAARDLIAVAPDWTRAQSVTGYGKATKRQVQELTRTLLRLDAPPKPDDAADALAMAICHAYSHRSRQYGLTLTKRQQQGYF